MGIETLANELHLSPDRRLDPRYMMKLKKACGCPGSSSGPRIVVKDVTPGGRLDPQKYRTKITLAPMVCDVCNSPWLVS